MATNNDGNVSEGDRYYWKNKYWSTAWNLWSTGVGKNETSTDFELHSKKWRYSANFVYGSLSICISSLNGIGSENHLFDMQAGIVGDGRKELAVVKEVAFSKTYLLMTRRDLDRTLKTHKEVFLFVEMRRKAANDQRIKIPRPKIETDYTEMLLSGRYSDVTLEVQGQKFNCHRCIIGARSPVLAAMFEHDMKEKSSGVVSIGDAEPAVFQEFLLYLYSANDDQLSLDNAAELYKLGDKYGVEDLKNVCRDEIQENMDKDNFFEVFMLSQLYSDSELTEKAMQFFLKDPQEMMGGESWDTFLSENPVESALLMKALDDEAKK